MKFITTIELCIITTTILLGGCGGERHYQYTCPDFSTDSQYKPTSGSLVVNYDGFAGVIKKSEIRLFVYNFVYNEEGQVVYFKGCRDQGDYIWMELGVSVPPSPQFPLEFDANDSDSAHASAFLEICPDGDCSRRRITEFNRLPARPVGLEGTVNEFGPGILDADLVLRDLDEKSRETGALDLDIDLRW